MIRLEDVVGAGVGHEQATRCLSGYSMTAHRVERDDRGANPQAREKNGAYSPTHHETRRRMSRLSP